MATAQKELHRKVFLLSQLGELVQEQIGRRDRNDGRELTAKFLFFQASARGTCVPTPKCLRNLALFLWIG